MTIAGGSSSTSNRSPTARRVCSPITTESRGARPCIREAVLTTSPATASPTCGPVPNVTTASPVFTAIRTATSGSTVRRRSSMLSRMRSAAWIARAGSSSCATGAPNTPSTASPMNLSNVPPNRSRSSFALAWKGMSVRRTSSGSARSERSVNPTRSTNSTVTTRRSAEGPASGCRSVGAPVASAAPQCIQKRACGRFSVPQFGHLITGRILGAGSEDDGSRCARGPKEPAFGVWISESWGR